MLPIYLIQLKMGIKTQKARDPKTGKSQQRPKCKNNPTKTQKIAKKRADPNARTKAKKLKGKFS